MSIECGLPPEYCQFGAKDFTACKEWLSDRYPQMFRDIYNEGPVPEKKEDKAKEESKGDAKADGEEGEDGEKPKKKVKFGKNKEDLGMIKVHKQKRGGRKVICQIVGMEYYTKDLKSIASKFGKKFSCGCNLATDELLGDCISVQGDIEERLLEILEQDKDLAKLEIPPEKIKFFEDGNKKGRKRA